MQHHGNVVRYKKVIVVHGASNANTLKVVLHQFGIPLGVVRIMPVHKVGCNQKKGRLL